MLFWLEAAGLCLVFAWLVGRSVLRQPLEWVSDYPPAIRRRAAELGLIPAEAPRLSPRVVARKVVGAAVAAVVLALLLVYANGAVGFVQGFALSYGLWLVLDWFDALVLDCLWFCHDKRVRLPGTEDLVDAYQDYGFHIRMSCIGMLLGLPVCAVTGLLVGMLTR